MRDLYIKPDYYVPKSRWEKVLMIRKLTNNPKFSPYFKTPKQISAIYHSVMQKAHQQVN